jgi:hypothetical protein
MTWNLAYHHLCDYVIRNRLTDFNNRWQVVYPGHHRKTAKAISVMDDFGGELKESEVIEICNSAGIITKDDRYCRKCTCWIGRLTEERRFRPTYPYFMNRALRRSAQRVRC